MKILDGKMTVSSSGLRPVITITVEIPLDEVVDPYSGTNSDEFVLGFGRELIRQLDEFSESDKMQIV